MFDYAPGHVTHQAWGQIRWTAYNTLWGETRPACGDVDGDGKDEIVVGLAHDGAGYLEVLDDQTAGYDHLWWARVHWNTYNQVNGETWPACEK